jgi:hypothetical protein
VQAIVCALPTGFRAFEISARGILGVFRCIHVRNEMKIGAGNHFRGISSLHFAGNGQLWP